MDSNSMGGKVSPRRQLTFEESNEESSPIEEDGINLMDINNMKDLEAIHSRMDEKMIPKLGTKFKNEEDARKFYLAYAKHVGFGIKKARFHKKNGNLVDRTFCCSAQGMREQDKRRDNVKDPRPETRFGCLAKMRVNRMKSGEFYVADVVLEHNHYLASPQKVHLFRSHRDISETQAADIEMSNSVGIAPKNAHELMAKQAGGKEALGFTHVDYKNYLRTKRQKEIEPGDTYGVLEYLQRMQFEDPNFSYAIQVDGYDMMTNIFWCDAKMKTDFVNFGDVVCFDTTYGKNKEGRPIALFVGVNDQKQSVVFGSALLYDETAKSFEWLFNTFSVAMSGAKPKTILTDQDAAMAKALALTWPETHHRLCIWRIYQNAAIHLSHVFSEFSGFLSDFKRCIYDFDEEEDFFREWKSMLDKYDLNDNAWLKRLFEIREKWALVYGRQFFCGDMTTTQRSESMNMLLKRYVSYQNKFLDFFNNFERMIENRRYDEMVADFKANTSVPTLKFPSELNKHATSIYTPEVFSLFQEELSKCLDTSCEGCEGDEVVHKYKITPVRKRYHHIVTHDAENETFDCTCKKFQFAGILCSHVLRIFFMKGLFKIPDKYILKRWTRKAKIGHAGDVIVGTSDLDPKTLQRLRYKDLCQLNMQLATKASEMEDTYIMARSRILETLDIVDAELQNLGKSVNTVSMQITSSAANANEVEVNTESGITVKGIKTKQKPNSGKRLKGGLEEPVRKKISHRENIKKKSCDASGSMPQHYQPTMTVISMPQHYQPAIPATSVAQHYLPMIPVTSLASSTNPPHLLPQWPTVHQHAQVNVHASQMLNPSYYESYLGAQSSQVHSSSSFNIDDVRSTLPVPSQPGKYYLLGDDSPLCIRKRRTRIGVLTWMCLN